jgi:nitrous oxidase accessory protein NosD
MRTRLVLSALALAFVAPVVFVPAHASVELCGTTILDNLTLDQDLVCPDSGLTVGADGIQINLNFHKISGSTAGIGITVVGRTGVSIANGVIRSFATAVMVNLSANVVIENVKFVGNAEGIDLQSGSSAVTIQRTAFLNSSIRAIMLRAGSVGNLITDNTFIGNRVGVLLFAPTGTTVLRNFISGSSLAAIRVNTPATGNLLLENTLVSGTAGIEFLITPAGSATGNTLMSNNISFNTCGVKGPSAGNTFAGNQLLGNVMDTCN